MKALVIVMSLCVAVPAFAQRGGRGATPKTCEFYSAPQDLPPTSHSFATKSSTGRNMTFIGGGFKGRCRGTNMVVSSDSMEYSEDARVLTLIGRARYQEDSTSIDANTIRYLENEQRIIAEGNVRLRSRTGSTLNSNQVNYLRPLQPARPYSMVDSYGRSHLVSRDSVKMTDSAATTIDADHLHMERDSIYIAGGRVIITRPDLKATADSSESNTGKHTARLIGGSPHIEGVGGKKFSVDGRIIDIFGRVKNVDSVFALGRGVAVSDSMTLSADTLHMHTTGNLINRVLAFGPGIARAKSPDRDITARRIELTMPGQRLRELLAVGKARAETKPDSLSNSKERDWIEGDTLNAHFEQLAAKDTARQPPLHDIVSRGSARSFYQIPPKQRSDSLPTLNYVIGKRIDVAFKQGEVQDVRVTGEVRGLNLTPQARDTTTKAPATPPKRGRQ